DNGTEFKNANLIEICGSKGIRRDYSNPKTPQQNRFAERKNQTLIEAAHTMLADSYLPTIFWTEAVANACYVLNRVLVTKPHAKTPYELLTGNKPSISYLKPFGCHVSILNTSDSLGKFDKKLDEGYIVGYSISSKAYRVYNLVSRKIEETMNLIFLKNKPFVAGTGQAWMFNIDYLTDSLNYSRVSSTNLTAGNQSEKSSNVGSQKDDSDSDDEPYVLIIHSTPTLVVPIVDEATIQHAGTKEANHLGLAFLSLNPILDVDSASIGSSVSAVATPPISAGSTPPMSPCASPIFVDRPSISAGKSHVPAVSPSISTGRSISADRSISTGIPVSASRPSCSAARTPIPAGRILGKVTEKIFTGLRAIGYATEGKFTFFKNKFSPQWKFLIHTLIHCLSPKSGSWNQFASNIATTRTKFLMYPRFLQIILDVDTEDITPYPAPLVTKKIFANMRHSQGPDMPLLAHMLNQGEPAVVQPQPQEVSSPSSSSVVEPHPSTDLMHSPPRMVDLMNQRRKAIAEMKAKAKRDKPMTPAQQREYMRTFVKNQSTTIYTTGWTWKDVQGLSDDQLQNKTPSVSAGSIIAAGALNYAVPSVSAVLTDSAASSVPADTPIAAGVPTTTAPSRSTEPTVHLRKSSRKKSMARKRTLLSPSKSESTNLPFDEDDPEAKFKKYLRQVSDDDEPAEPVSLALVSDVRTWEIIPTEFGLGEIHVITRADGTVKRFYTLRELIHWVGRADLMVLYGMVSDKYKLERATGIGLGLWSDLRTLITAREDRDVSIIWDDQDQWEIRSWRFYPLPVIHVLETKAGDIIYMFVDKKYPILPATIQRMLNHGLEIDRDPSGNDLTTAIQLIRSLLNQLPHAP
nr:ribonuclease H-like domain-containing protein [Tanacetum cinerariifolium]